MSNATLDLAKLLISPESNLKEIDAFDDAAHAIACGYIDLQSQLNECREALAFIQRGLRQGYIKDVSLVSRGEDDGIDTLSSYVDAALTRAQQLTEEGK